MLEDEESEMLDISFDSAFPPRHIQYYQVQFSVRAMPSDPIRCLTRFRKEKDGKV
jgi:hypothetical protein